MASTLEIEIENIPFMTLNLIPASEFMMGMEIPEQPVLINYSLNVFLILILLAGSIYFIITCKIKFQKKHRIFQFDLRHLYTLIALLCAFGLSVQEYSAFKIKMLQYILDIKYLTEFGGLKSTPQHMVTLDKPFYLGIYEVTQKQFRQIMGYNDSYTEEENKPVDNISWYEAKTFCDKLSKHLNSKYYVRLPTEAEWEFACRSGTNTPHYSGSSEIDLLQIAWFNKNSNGQPSIVGKKFKNDFGLYDMLGNVSEWCENEWVDYSSESDYLLSYKREIFIDEYNLNLKKSLLSSPNNDSIFYDKIIRMTNLSPFNIADSSNPFINYDKTIANIYVVVRGGFWGSEFLLCRNYSRFWHTKDFKSPGLGFRVLIEIN